MADIIVNVAAGTTTPLTPVAIPDDQHTVNLSIPAWANAAQVLSIVFELSFDSGASWRSLGQMNPTAGGTLSPRQPAVGVVLSPLPLLCSICGNTYLPGDLRFHRALSHSTIALKAGVDLAALRARLRAIDRTLTVPEFQNRIALGADGTDIDDLFFDRVFHTPTPVLPANRLMRFTVTCSRALNTIFTWTASA